MSFSTTTPPRRCISASLLVMTYDGPIRVRVRVRVRVRFRVRVRVRVSVSVEKCVLYIKCHIRN